MSNTVYKPLTPKLREDITTSIDRNIEELNTCKSNAYVNFQLCAHQMLKKLINALPDGYPLPMERTK